MNQIFKRQMKQGHEYFLKLIENIPESKKDLDLIKIAHSKLKQYSE